MSTHISSIQLNAIRKFSEDPNLRGFLSSHFDAQNYIKVSYKIIMLSFS